MDCKPGLCPAFLLRQRVHPTIRIIFLLALAGAVYIAPLTGLAVLLAGLVVMMLHWRAENFLKLLKKMRWLLFFLLVIYAFNTPGEYLRQWPFDIMPTYEGLYAGILQASRIIIMLAGVSLLLTTTSRDSLMTGFFLLLYPLKWMGLSPERLAVRLWLTLHYVETAQPARSIAGFMESLEQVNQAPASASAPDEVHFELPPLTWRDGIGLFLLIFLVLMLL